jgi:hypothetical protein
LGILAGIVVALAIQAGTDVLSNILYPAAITDSFDQRQVSEAFAARPTGALLITVLGFFLASLGGGFIARRIARRGWAVWVPAGLFVLMALAIVLAYPLPAWTGFASVLAPLIGGLLARHIGVDPAPEAMAVEAPSDADL